jgi:branched-chain amino acid transport system substrate-binding protein
VPTLTAAAQQARRLAQAGVTRNADWTPYVEEINGVKPPQAFHAHGADAMNILINAIEQVAVQGDDGTLYVPKGALRDAVYATKDYQGLTGNITCTPTGDCGAGAIGAYIITEDTVNGTWPPPCTRASNSHPTSVVRRKGRASGH